MNIQEFIEQAISPLDSAFIDRLKKSLINERYIPITFVDFESIDAAILEEKIKDYFEKVEISHRNSFTNTIENYVTFLDSVVLDHIDKYSDADKSSLSRAKRYYDKAKGLKKIVLNSFDALIDYSRIMMCLYMAIINNRHNGISDFDFSSECLKGKEILEALRKEEVVNLLSKRMRFDTREPYGADRSAFIMLIIMYHYIKSMEVEE